MRGIRGVGLASFCMLLLAVPAHVFGQETDPAEEGSITVILNGEEIGFEEPLQNREGRIFVPIRQFAEYFGGEVEWEESAKEAAITTVQGDQLVFTPGNPVMTFNGREYRMDAAPFLDEQRAYVPIRHAAQFMHIQVEWDPETQTAALTEVPLHTVQEGETLATISEAVGTTPELLSELNGLEPDAAVEPEMQLKVVVPDIVAVKIEPPQEPEASQNIASPREQEQAPESEWVIAGVTEEDIMLLAKIVQAEAGHDSYESQLAVANVVVNRVKDSAFPDTIRGVIYAPGQFPPAHNGTLDQTEPSESAVKAAKAALAGENNVEGALYFYNPDVTSGAFWESLTLIAEIGNHRFMGR
mgnify:CR=1 FL=1